MHWWQHSIHILTSSDSTKRLMNSLPLSVCNVAGHWKSAKMSYRAFATWMPSWDGSTLSHMYLVKWSCTTRMMASSGWPWFLYLFLVFTLKQSACRDSVTYKTYVPQRIVRIELWFNCEICATDSFYKFSKFIKYYILQILNWWDVLKMKGSVLNLHPFERVSGVNGHVSFLLYGEPYRVSPEACVAAAHNHLACHTTHGKRDRIRQSDTENSSQNFKFHKTTEFHCEQKLSVPTTLQSIPSWVHSVVGQLNWWTPRVHTPKPWRWIQPDPAGRSTVRVSAKGQFIK